MKKIVVLMLMCVSPLIAQYKLTTSVFGGGGSSSGTGYKLSGSVSQVNVGTSSSGGNIMNIGFWNIYKAKSVPVVTTGVISSITLSSAGSGGEVISAGWFPVTARGVCWNTTGLPTIADSKTTDGSGIGAFASSITGLTQSTTYYVRAYATNSTGTGYGNEVIFVTIPTLPEWGLIIFGSFIAIFAVRKIIRAV